MKKLIATFVLTTATVASAYAENLTDLYQIAINSDPSLQAALANYNSNKELVPLARGSLLPQINLTASNTRTKAANASLNNSRSSHGINLSLQQALLNFQAWYAYKQAGSLVHEARNEYIAEQQNLIFRLTSAYFGVLKAKDTLHFKSAQKKAVAQQLEQIQQKFDVGLVAVTDKREAQANFDLAAAALIQAENSLYEANEKLEEITGQPVQNLAPLKEQFPLHLPSPVSIESWQNVSKQTNPNILIAKDLRDASVYNKKLTFSQNLPSFSLTANRSQTRPGDVWNSDDGNHLNDWSVSLNMSMNIFAGGAQWADTKKAKFAVEQAQHELEKVERSAQTATKNAYRSVVSSISQSNALKQAVLSAKTALKATQAANEVGTRTSVDVLDSIAILYDSQEKYTAARHTYILGQLALKQAAGILSETDLKEVNNLLVKEQE